MKILLSPSKKMDFEKQVKINFTQPCFLNESTELINNLRKLSKEDISRIMKLSHQLTELNFERYKSFSTPFTSDNAKPAAYAFQGDVYDGLEFETLDKESVKFAQDNLRILSGLYGLLKPLDLIQPYRLEMGTKLENPKGKNLYEFWNSKITDKLNDEEQDLIVNLASNEYFKAVKPKLSKATIVTPTFKEFKNGSYKIIMIFAKRARGMMAKYIIENKITDIEKLKNFNLDGYKYNSNLSDKENIVFTRNSS